VFSTIESMTWSTMMFSMMAAGIASQHAGIRLIGTISGLASSSTAIFWGWANWHGKLPEPALTQDDPVVEIHGDPTT
jgi:hypothetical protein